MISAREAKAGRGADRSATRRRAVALDERGQRLVRAAGSRPERRSSGSGHGADDATGEPAGHDGATHLPIPGAP